MGAGKWPACLRASRLPRVGSMGRPHGRWHVLLGRPTDTISSVKRVRCRDWAVHHWGHNMTAFWQSDRWSDLRSKLSCLCTCRVRLQRLLSGSSSRFCLSPRVSPLSAVEADRTGRERTNSPRRRLQTTETLRVRTALRRTYGRTRCLLWGLIGEAQRRRSPRMPSPRSRSRWLRGLFFWRPTCA